MTKIFNLIRSLGFYRGPERLLGGIGGGIARQFGLSVGAVRLVMLIAFLIPGFGLGTYLTVWILTPSHTGSIPLERFLDGWQGLE